MKPWNGHTGVNTVKNMAKNSNTLVNQLCSGERGFAYILGSIPIRDPILFTYPDSWRFIH